MRVIYVLFCLLVAFSAPAATPEVGKDALRKLVKLPVISFQSSWTFNPERGFSLGSTEADTTNQINLLAKQLKGDVNDAETLQQIGELYSILNEPTLSRKTWRLSADMYRKRVESQSDDAVLLAGLGWSLQGAGKPLEAESVLRKAVQLAPKEWRCRVALGRFLAAQARQDLGDRLPNATRPSSAKVAQAQKHLVEAGENFDRAVAAAPDQWEVYFRRGMFRYLNEELKNQIRVAEGEQRPDVDDANNPFSPASLADLQHASQLNPRDYALVGGVVLYEIYSVSARKGNVNWAEFSLGALPDKSQRSIREAMTRLENLGQDTDPQRAAGALEVLAVLQGPVLHETRTSIATFHRALALDGSRQQAWEIMMGTLAQAERFEDLLAACEQRLKQQDTPRTHLLLSKTYAKLKQWDEAESEVAQVLQRSPDHLLANLAMSAFVLRRSRTAAELEDANGWLTRTERVFGDIPKPQRDQQIAVDLTLMRSIYFALTDETEIARKWIGAVLKQDKDNKLARDILSAMDY